LRAWDIDANLASSMTAKPSADSGTKASAEDDAGALLRYRCMI
jgi:hypothetical protein